jgi:hypothetical protein
MVQNRRLDSIPQPWKPNPIQLLTENDFCIIRLCDVDESIPSGGIEHSFIVRDPDGYELDITVSLDPRAAAELIHRSRGRLNLESSFWVNCAERHLANYLWQNNDFPPDGTLKVSEPDLDDIDSAQRWRADVTAKTLAALLLFLACFSITAKRVSAQQTVFNVPTTDVLDKGKIYFELDISAKPNDSKAIREFSSFVPRLVVGTGHHIEAGLNVIGNIQPGPDTTTLVPAFKLKAYDGKENGWAIAVGDHIFIPVRNKSYNAGDHAYVIAQKTFETKTRIGFGAGVFTKNVVAPNAVRGAGEFTFEQPITKKLNWNADWFTGKHANGYFTTGAAYKLTKKLTGVAAYSIGNANASKGNHFFYFELGYNFN